MRDQDFRHSRSREFDVDTQTSVRNLQSADILLEAAEQRAAFVRDYIAADHLRLEIEPEEENRDADVLIIYLSLLQTNNPTRQMLETLSFLVDEAHLWVKGSPNE